MISKFKHHFIKAYFCTSISVVTLYAQDIPQDTIVFREAEVIILSDKTVASTPLLSRPIEIIQPSQIGNIAPTTSVHDLLQFTSGLDAQTRGPAGIQTDISMRGGSFEQTLILVDGIPIRDPQTGHHALNLPFNSDLIEQVEILKGPGSRSFGANAMSGIIQFITRTEPENNLKVNIGGGEFGFFEASLSGGVKYDSHNHIAAIHYSKSDGYRSNTDFINKSVSYSGSVNLNANKIHSFIGFNEKEFGANGFYSSRFPNQFEKTRTLFANLRGEFPVGKTIINPQIFYRRHNDDFVLKRENPSFYHNMHTTEIFGASIHNKIESHLGNSIFSAAITFDKINSTNLGNHSRQEVGFSAEHLIPINNSIKLSAGTYVYNFSGWGWGATPGADISYIMNDENQFYISIAMSYRIPTYTELYYTDPNHYGNPKLKPERGIALELGWQYNLQWLKLNANAFQHNLTDGIDWIKYTQADIKAQSANLTKITKRGFEISMLYFPTSEMLGLKSLQAEYTYTDAFKSVSVFESRYLLTHLRHHATLRSQHNLLQLLDFYWTSRYYDRSSTGKAILFDIAFLYNMDASKISLKANNIFNKTYAHITGVPLPGRWLTILFEYNI